MAINIREFLRRGPATSKEIQAATGLSQAGVSRQLQAMDSNIVRLTDSRPPRYALTCPAFGADDRLDLYMVDPHGNSVCVGVLRPLAHGGFFLKPGIGMPAILLGENRDGLYDGLPWFLDDLRPQGFIGRQIAAQMHAQDADFPADPRHWNSNHIGRYLISNGDDLSGNFKLGPLAHLRLRHPPVAVSTQAYPALAEQVLRGEVPGSSAGGEQPKFTAFSAELQAHVIVKFSPPGNDPLARRWRDILLTEYHATEVLHEQSWPAAETRLMEIEGRLFLESRRFDRSGMHGRMPMVSLQAADAEFTGLGSNWVRVMAALDKLGLVSRQHLIDVQLLWCFGRLINNTDMHLGNLSLAIEGDVFRLLPAYDMCSMGFAPKGGELLPFEFATPDLEREGFDSAIPELARRMARSFWLRLKADPRISDELRQFLQNNRLAE